MKFISTSPKRILSILGFIVLFTFIVILQLKYDEIEHPRYHFTTETRYVAPASFVKKFSFGFDNVLADLYWIKTIQDFSIWDGVDPFYFQEYHNIAVLDPLFSYPYILGILTVTSKTNKTALEGIEPISKIGIEKLPYNWEIPFYLARGFHLAKDYDKALEYTKIAISRPIIPDMVANFYNIYAKKKWGDKEANQAFLKTIIDTTKSTTTKKILKQGVAISTITTIIQTAAETYKEKYGTYPESIDELANKKLLGFSPALKSEFIVLMDKQTGHVQVFAR
jgi:hypothetical protein